MKPVYSILLRLAIVVPALLVIASIALLVRSWNRSEEATDAVARSYELQVEIEALFASVQALANTQNAFLLTGNETLLEPFPAARNDVLRRLRAVEPGASEGVTRHPELAQLRPLVHGVISLARASIDHSRRSEGSSREATLVADAARRQLEELRTTLDRLRERESAYRKERLAELSQSTSNQRRVAASIIGVQILLGLALAITAQRFASLRQLVTMCAWTKKIKSRGQWVTLEEYLSAEHRVDVTHGISPEEAAKHLPRRRAASA